MQQFNKRWVVIFRHDEEHEGMDVPGESYLTEIGGWTGKFLHADNWEQESAAEEAAANMVLSDPSKYFGRVFIHQTFVPTYSR